MKTINTMEECEAMLKQYGNEYRIENNRIKIKSTHESRKSVRYTFYLETNRWTSSLGSHMYNCVGLEALLTKYINTPTAKWRTNHPNPQ